VSYAVALLVMGLLFAGILFLCARGDAEEQKKNDSGAFFRAGGTTHFEDAPTAKPYPTITFKPHYAPEEIDVEAFIDAFAQVEGWQGRPGAKGEQGIWQWTEPTWRRFSRRDFLWAALRTPEAIAEQRATARRMIADYGLQLQKRNQTLTPFNLALMVKAGDAGFWDFAFPWTKVDASERVENLYREAVGSKTGGAR
jgi:hypothetical protein